MELGGQVKLIAMRWYKEMDSLLATRSRCYFLLMCKHYKVVPNHINNITKKLRDIYLYSNNHRLGKKLNSQVDRANLNMINVKLADLNILISYLRGSIRDIEINLNTYINSRMISFMKNYFSQKLILINNNFREKLNNKIATLYYQKFGYHIDIGEIKSGGSYKEQIVTDPYHGDDVIEKMRGKFVVNLTGTELPQRVIATLQLGRNFNFQSDLDSHTTMELFKGLNKRALDNELINFEFRKDILKIIRKRHDRKLLNLQKFVTGDKIRRDIKFTNTFFRDNSDLCIVKSDKGGP